MKILIAICLIGFIGLTQAANWDTTKKWNDDYKTRRTAIQADVDSKPTDDATTTAYKNAAKGHLQIADNYQSAFGAQADAANNIWSVSIMQVMEANLSAAGRYIYGARWTEEDCGSGMNWAKCGKKP